MRRTKSISKGAAATGCTSIQHFGEKKIEPMHEIKYDRD
jgi:hypothetical protein